MELKKFREYPFTADTKAKWMNNWHAIESVHIHFSYELENSIILESEEHSEHITYCHIQELREKPKEIFVNVFQDETIKIYNKYIDSRYWDDGQKLLKRFKGIECEYIEWRDCKGWKTLLNKQGYYWISYKFVMKYSKSILELQGSDKYYILELIYNSEQAPEKPKKIELLSESFMQNKQQDEINVIFREVINKLGYDIKVLTEAGNTILEEKYNET